MNTQDIWDICFSLAWHSFVDGSIPIGAVIVDNLGNILVQGRNSIYSNSNNCLPGKISHAEMNALVSFNKMDIACDPRDCILFSTMEPCSMCLGATVFSNIRKLVYATEDAYAGAINEHLIPKYIDNRIEATHDAPYNYDNLQIVFQTVYLLEKSAKSIVKKNNSIELWSKQYASAVALGESYYMTKTLRKLANQNASFCEVKSVVFSDLERSKHVHNT